MSPGVRIFAGVTAKFQSIVRPMGSSVIEPITFRVTYSAWYRRVAMYALILTMAQVVDADDLPATAAAFVTAAVVAGVVFVVVVGSHRAHSFLHSHTLKRFSKPFLEPVL